MYSGHIYNKYLFKLSISFHEHHIESELDIMTPGLLQKVWQF